MKTNPRLKTKNYISIFLTFIQHNNYTAEKTTRKATRNSGLKSEDTKAKLGHFLSLS